MQKADLEKLEESFLRTAYEEEPAGNIEQALLEAIRIFRDDMEAGNPSDFSCSWKAYSLLSNLYIRRRDEKKAVEILDEAKRIIENGMKKDEHAFAPYLAKYYYSIGYIYAYDGTLEYEAPFRKAAGLFRSFLRSDHYTDSEKESFRFHIEDMDQVERDIYWRYM